MVAAAVSAESGLNFRAVTGAIRQNVDSAVARIENQAQFAASTLDNNVQDIARTIAAPLPGEGNRTRLFERGGLVDISV